nr:LacI family DNA-binding transcriptional regulator [Actinopolyspora xinjiangensis]
MSRALNGKGTVDSELVARVVAAAAELDYRPNGPGPRPAKTGNHGAGADHLRCGEPVLHRDLARCGGRGPRRRVLDGAVQLRRRP